MSNETDRSEPGDEAVVGRRDVVRMLAAAPLAVFAITMEDVQRASDGASAALEALATRGQAFAPKFFTAAEWPQVRLLADLVIPRDERSGSATDAGVPEFMDFMMTAYPDMQKGMREGLAWVNTEASRRFGRSFVACTTADQHRILDDIAYPKKAAASMKAGVEFFSRFRNLTASGFWSSKIGVADLQYMGNRALAAWTGCPAPALRKLGVAYKS